MPIKKNSAGPVSVFFSYSHKDEALKNQLLTHLKGLERGGVIGVWHDRKITAGHDWATEIDSHLKEAKIILLLISANFIASDYCSGIELQQAMRRHSRKSARVIPIILRPCDWKIMPLSRLQALPTDGKPITRWTNRDAAFTEVAQGIRRAVEELNAAATRKRTAAQTHGPQTDKVTGPPVSARPRRKVEPAVTAGVAETGTPPRRQPKVGTRRPAPVPGTTKSPTKKAAPLVNLLPRDVVVKQVEDAFKDRPKARSGLAWLQVVWASLREDVTLNPTLFIDDKFRADVQRVAHLGSPPLLAFEARNAPQANTTRLQILQQHDIAEGRGGHDHIQITLSANGVVSVALNVTSLSGRDMSDWAAGMRIDPDDVQKRLEQAWGFAVRWWRHRFKVGVVSGDKLLYNIGLFDTDNYPFGRSPQGAHRTLSFSMRTRPNPLMLYQEPKPISGSQFTKSGPEIADVLKMLKMRFDES
jgi:hypothetical protein